MNISRVFCSQLTSPAIPFATDAATRRHARLVWQIKCSVPRNCPMMRSTTTHDPLAEATGSNQAGWQDGVERRRSPRATLHWTLYLMCGATEHPLRTEVSNISRDGFYCLLNQSIRPGERIKCDIVVPAHNSQDPDDVVYLRCNAQAVRVETIRAGAEFGLACRVHDYCIIHGNVRGFQTPGRRPNFAA